MRRSLAGRLALAALVGLLPEVSWAQHRDWLHAIEGNRVVTGITDFETLTTELGVRVLHAAFPGSDLTNSPGWTASSSPPGGAERLPGNQLLTFNIIVPPGLDWNLSFWDGREPVLFGPPPNAERLRFQPDSSLGAADPFAIADGSGEAIAGFAIGTTSETGFLHQHIHYQLLNNGQDLPTPGVYLVGLEAETPGHEPSAPFYTVFYKSVSAAIADQAVDWVEQNLIADQDGDELPDSIDNCPFHAAPAQGDVDADRRGDACECGDQNGDGRNTVADLVAINQAIFNPSLVTPLCDSNGDQLCNVADIVTVNVEIFSPGNTSTCARQPQPGP